MKSIINFKGFLIFCLLIIISNKSNSNECLTKKGLNIGFIEDSYIDYKYYLYYALGDYSLLNDIEFTISEVNQNANEFDIIFGEYRDLEKLSLNQTQIPDKVLNFYKDNEIEIIGNLFPLDLDTFIILSKDNNRKLTFEEFSKLYNPIKYTLGMSFQTKEDMINLLIYHLEQPSINLNSVSFELILDLFVNTYENLNKNILNNDFLEVYNSFENSENVHTLFSDGILLNKNISFENNNDKLSDIFALYLDTSTSSILLANERLLCVLNRPIISLIISYSFKQFDISFPDKFLIFPFHLSIN